MIKPGIIFAIFQLGMSLAVMGVSCLYFQYLPIYGYLAGINLATFITMGTDKLQAQRNGLRVPELNFFIAALIGGVAGVYAGIWVFRHKTRKAKFIFYLILITFAQMLLLIYFSEQVKRLF